MVFVPGLKDKRLIGRLCAALEMPVNIMLDAPLTPINLEAGCNLAHISIGPLGYLLACKDLATRFGACTDDVLSVSRGLKTGQYEKRASAKMAPNGYQRNATDASTMSTVTQWPVAPEMAGLLGYFA